MTGNPARQARVASQMQRALMTLLRRGVKDPRVGNVTVTAVTLASDMTSATVYVLPFAGRGTEAPAMLAGLESASGYLRSQLSRELKLRHMPRLQFCLDEQLDRAHQLTSLIDHAVADDAARAQEQQPEQPEPQKLEPGVRGPSSE